MLEYIVFGLIVLLSVLVVGGLIAAGKVLLKKQEE